MARISTDVKDRIVRLYTTPMMDGSWMGAKLIASKVGCVPTSVHNVLRERGIPIRSARESHAGGKRCKPVKNLPPQEEVAPLCKCGCAGNVAWNRRKNRWNAYIDGHYRQDAAYKDADWLRAQYVDARRSIAELADECGVGERAVTYQLIRHGIPRRTGSDAHRGRQAGFNNPAWRGGTTPERQRLYKTQAWKDLVKAVYARDGYRCVRCGTEKIGGIRFHAHHMARWSEFPALRFEMTNLVTLCQGCHTWVHSRQNVERSFLV